MGGRTFGFLRNPPVRNSAGVRGNTGQHGRGLGNRQASRGGGGRDGGRKSDPAKASAKAREVRTYTSLARCVRGPENPVLGAGSKMCFCKQKPPWQGGVAPVASPGKRRFSVDKRLSSLCLPRPRGQTGTVAIYSLHLRSVGRTTHAPRTAGAHIRYITRPEARADLLAGRMPGERNAARRWLDREERRDRQNARVIDKLTVALPRRAGRPATARAGHGVCRAGDTRAGGMVCGDPPERAGRAQPARPYRHP
jgi:hypothetical protein